jgi:hypothetical protein
LPKVREGSESEEETEMESQIGMPQGQGHTQGQNRVSSRTEKTKLNPAGSLTLDDVLGGHHRLAHRQRSLTREGQSQVGIETSDGEARRKDGQHKRAGIGGQGSTQVGNHTNELGQEKPTSEEQGHKSPGKGPEKTPTEAKMPKVRTPRTPTKEIHRVRTPRTPTKQQELRFGMAQSKEVKIESKLEKCPKGHDMRDGVCIEKTSALESAPTAIVCQPGYVYRNSRCLPVEIIPTQCRKGYEYQDGTCVLTVKVVTTPSPCQNGYIFKDWKCIKEEVRKCGDGLIERDGTCVPVVKSCGVGYELKNDTCVRIAKTCDSGFVVIDGKCVKKCGQGFELKGGKCEEKVKNPQCPPGYVFKDEQCVMANNPCPYDFAYIKNRCVRMGKNGPIPDDSNESEEKCGPGGYKYINGRCIPRMMLGSELPEVECPDGYEFKFGRCLGISVI